MQKAKNTILVLAMAFAMAIVLAGCGGNGGTASNGSGSESSSSSAASASATSSSSNPTSAPTAQGEASVRINTEGMGVISWSYADDEPEFNADMPYQSAVVNDAAGQMIHIEAQDYEEYEGWHFTKWMKDGTDYSTFNRIDVVVDGDAEYIAVFEFAEK